VCLIVLPTSKKKLEMLTLHSYSFANITHSQKGGGSISKGVPKVRKFEKALQKDGSVKEKLSLRLNITP
jgi:hypothetical protein